MITTEHVKRRYASKERLCGKPAIHEDILIGTAKRGLKEEKLRIACMGCKIEVTGEILLDELRADLDGAL